MQTHLVMVGKTTGGWLQKGVQEYLGRLQYYLTLRVIEIPDVKNRRNKTPEELKKEEGRLILKKIEPGDQVVLLDEEGENYTSREFSRFMQKQMLAGHKRLMFVTGGAYGFSSEVYQRAGLTLSLSSMTFPHQLVRLIFVEQLYRAMTLLKGEPYHHD